MVTRRSFLKGLAGCLAASQAPAIVKAENLMKVIAPKEPVLLTSTAGLTSELREAIRTGRYHDDVADALGNVQTVPITVKGLTRGDRVLVMDKNTGEILINEEAKAGRVEHKVAYVKDRQVSILVRNTDPNREAKLVPFQMDNQIGDGGLYTSVMRPFDRNFAADQEASKILRADDVPLVIT